MTPHRAQEKLLSQVTATAKHADDVFDDLEKEEMQLTDSLSGLMKTSQFESLSKVMEASEYVEKVTIQEGESSFLFCSLLFLPIMQLM